MKIESVIKETEEKQSSIDVLREVYQKEISEIKDLYYEMLALVARNAHPYNPSAKFRSLVEKEFKEKNIKEKPESFLAYSYAIGNSEYENQLAFDTENSLIIELYRDFSKKVIEDLKS